MDKVYATEYSDEKKGNTQRERQGRRKSSGSSSEDERMKEKKKTSRGDALTGHRVSDLKMMVITTCTRDPQLM